ncbi:MAG: DUF4397 domain-containing protein [Burkholderiales bacterium]
MKNLKWWGLVSAAAVSIALAACGGNGNSSSDSASLRVVNATLNHPSIDLFVNAAASVSATASDTVSAYVAPASGGNTLQVNDAGGGTALATIVPTLTGGNHYTLFAYESAGAVKTVVLNEDQVLPTAGSAYLRIYNVAADAGKLDVYITDPSTTLANASSPISLTTGTTPFSTGYALQGAGTWRVRVTGYGNKSDLRLDMPLVLASQQVATVVLSPTSGGVLLNGSTLIQQSTYAATRNTNVRVRLAAAVSGSNSVVAASAGSAVIDAGSLAPAFGYYALVPASSTLNISVNGASVGAPATALAAGSDMTLLVYGPAASPAASLITDDNRPPSDTTTVKLRLINGITGSAGALTLTANTSLVAAGVAPGTASGYVAVLGSANPMNLSVTSSLAPGNYFTNASNTLNSGSVYSVMMGGDASAPQMLIR